MLLSSVVTTEKKYTKNLDIKKNPRIFIKKHGQIKTYNIHVIQVSSYAHGNKERTTEGINILNVIRNDITDIIF